MTPWWTFKICLRTAFLSENSFAQMEQWNLSPWWSFLLCRHRLALLLKTIPQIWHVKGFSPIWFTAMKSGITGESWIFLLSKRAGSGLRGRFLLIFKANFVLIFGKQTADIGYLCFLFVKWWLKNQQTSE